MTTTGVKTASRCPPSTNTPCHHCVSGVCGSRKGTGQIPYVDAGVAATGVYASHHMGAVGPCKRSTISVIHGGLTNGEGVTKPIGYIGWLGGAIFPKHSARGCGKLPIVAAAIITITGNEIVVGSGTLEISTRAIITAYKSICWLCRGIGRANKCLDNSRCQGRISIGKGVAHHRSIVGGKTCQRC